MIIKIDTSKAKIERSKEVINEFLIYLGMTPNQLGRRITRERAKLGPGLGYGDCAENTENPEYKSGHEAGYHEGFKDGRDAGMRHGCSFGYSEGFKAGVIEGQRIIEMSTRVDYDDFIKQYPDFNGDREEWEKENVLFNQKKK